MALQMAFWDVQHGDAAFVKTPDGTTIVHDLGMGSLGDDEQRFSPLRHLKRNLIGSLDQLIVTHPHKDHIDDIRNIGTLLPKVFIRPTHITRDAILDDVSTRDRDLFQTYLSMDEHYHGPITKHQTSQATDCGVTIRTFHPKDPSQSNLNNHSLVTVISYAHSSIVLTGDNESPSWNYLLQNPDFRSAIEDADILVAPHHGRRVGYHPELFDYCSPKLTIISDGRYRTTSATSRYTRVSEGWKVHKRSGGTEVRSTVTTRQDGVVIVKFGFNDDVPYIKVQIN